MPLSAIHALCKSQFVDQVRFSATGGSPLDTRSALNAAIAVDDPVAAGCIATAEDPATSAVVNVEVKAIASHAKTGTAFLDLNTWARAAL